jgi:uncharacterized protein
VPLLSRVSGISPVLADNIVRHRDTNGPFASRRELKNVPRLGPKAYEQCAGFLRIAGGEDPLDASSVHPEAYSVVHKIVSASGGPVGELIGNTAVLRGLSPAQFVDDTFGLPTVTDILAELEKPGRDPRPAFTTAVFADGVEKVADLRPGMILEGVVTNVAAFGAFVDVGVHQDGLVHVSAMSTKFVKDPHEVVTSGQVVKVKVMEVDEARKRIALTLRLDDEPGARDGGQARDRSGGGRSKGGPSKGGDAAGSDGSKGARARGAGAPRGGSGGRDKGGQSGTRTASPRSAPAPASGAMADALRRAGLTT